MAVFSCSKDSVHSNVAIPYVAVNEKINVNDPLYNNLNNIGGWVYLNAGSRGIILYRESPTTVRAYERQCTFDPAEVCSTVDMNPAVLQANDGDCCGSVYSLLNGSILQGPASKPLLQYTTSFDGTYVLISN